MMKKFLYGMMAATMIFATSCENELELGAAGEESVVSFTIATPDMGSRAYSDGTTATVLQYAVYDAAGNELEDLTVTSGEIHGSTTVKLQLTTGNTYSVIFWAAAPNAPYTVDFANKEMTVDYDGAVSNAESRDAFYAFKEINVTGAQTETIELKRPFAQLNIGTSDYAASARAGYTPTQSAVTVKNVYSTLKLTSGDVENPVVAEFNAADIKKDETFPVAGYEYLAMNYLLVDDEKETVDVEFTYTDGSNAKTRTVGSVPVQRNYRTNIYGELLTSEVDINVTIEPNYNEEDYMIYNVVVDGVSYTNFAEAAAKAMELVKPIEFVQNVTIDADETITVPAGKTLNLNLNGYTLVGVSDQIGSNREMFLVKGTMTVNGANTMSRAAAAGNGIIAIKHKGDNMEWSAMTTVFDVTAGGVLNIKNANAINYGGSDMGFVAHLNNWGEVTLNVENSTLESNYVAVRVFNSGNDMNNVTINNSTLKGGSNAFWVHNYTAEDFGGDTNKVNTQKGLLNFDIFNGTNTFVGKNDTPIRYGMTNAVYVDENGLEKITTASGEVVEGIGTNMDGDYVVTSAEGFSWIAENIDKVNDQTIELNNDIDLSALSRSAVSNWTPIGTEDAVFSGTFDGNGKTIKNLSLIYNEPAYYIGFFGCVENATIKNVIFENITVNVASDDSNEGGHIAGIVGYAKNTTFENITVKGNVQVESTFENNASSRVAVVAGGNYGGEVIMKNVHVIANEGSYVKANNCVGALAGQLQVKVNFENCSSNIDVIGYKFFAGGIIGLSAGESTFTNCTTSGNVSIVSGRAGNANDLYRVGGIAGGWDDNINTPLTLTNCSYTGTISGKDANGTVAEILDCGGFVGRGYSTKVGPKVIVNGVEYEYIGNGKYKVDGYSPVASWDEFTKALDSEAKVVLTADITYDANYQLQKAVTIDLNGKAMTLPMINIHKATTVKNGTINGKVYARKNSDIVFDNVKFSGAVADNLSTEGHLAIQGGCKLYAKDCLFSPTSVSGSQTKPLSFEGGSSDMKFENCEFKSSPYKKQVYLNSLSATGSLEFINCNFNNKTPNIMFAAACPLTNLTMSGTTKLSSVTLETNRAKDAVTAEDLAYLRESLIANNSFSSVRLFYAGGSSEYIR